MRRPILCLEQEADLPRHGDLPPIMKPQFFDIVFTGVTGIHIPAAWCRHFHAVLLLWFVLAPLLLGAADPQALPIESSEGKWVFSLLPKSFQKNPLVDQTVITEMTHEGRKVAAPTAESPAYYVAVSAGAHNEGHAADSDRQPSDAVLADCLQRALAVNHFLPAGPEHPPTLLVVYVWGVHNNLDQGSDVIGVATPDVNHRNLLSRATLVGGAKFAADLQVALEAQDRVSEIPGPHIELLDPMRLFLARDNRTRRLYSQSSGDCYYLVASAYDYQTAAMKEGRKLLWRSKMTVDSSGVAMADTLPTLVLNSAAYLGRDMPEAATLYRPATRSTEVILGPLKVVGYVDDPDPVQEYSEAIKPNPALTEKKRP